MARRATTQKAKRAMRLHQRTLWTRGAHDAPAIVPMPETTPSTDHAEQEDLKCTQVGE